jgi:hypothetical protein
MVADPLRYLRTTDDSSALRELEIASERIRAIHGRLRLAHVQRLRGAHDARRMKQLAREFDEAVEAYRQCLNRTLDRWAAEPPTPARGHAPTAR